MAATARASNRFPLGSARPLVGAVALLAGVLGFLVSSSPAASAASFPGIESAGTGLNPAVRNARTVLPPNSSDNIDPVVPAGTSLSRAQTWLAGLISYRQASLFAAGNSITGARDISTANRTQLISLEQATASRLNTIAIRSVNDLSLTQVSNRAEEIVNLEILNVVVPQLRMLSHLDGLLGLFSQLSSSESAAATAIAISHQAVPNLRTERQLDATIQSLVSSSTASLTSTQKTLLSLVPANVALDRSSLTAARSTNSIAENQLHLANEKLRLLVGLLVGP